MDCNGLHSIANMSDRWMKNEAESVIKGDMACLSNLCIGMMYCMVESCISMYIINTSGYTYMGPHG